MLPPDLVNFLLNFTKKMIVIKEIVGYNSNRRNSMNKSSEIYDIAWDLASIVDNLDDSVLNVIRKGTQGTVEESGCIPGRNYLQSGRRTG